MVDEEGRESPLARFNLAARASHDTHHAGVVAHERAFLGHINLRGDALDPHFVGALSTVVGCELPIAANTLNDAQGNVMYWLGPDEWLIVTPGERAATIESELRTALTGMRAAVTDVSGGQTIVNVRGNKARELLAKGCPIDLHPRVFGIGQCAQSHIAKAPVIIGQLEIQPCFEIIIRRSFADYFWLWLENAAAEYGYAVAP